MRTYDEIRADVRHTVNTRAAAPIEALAVEMEQTGTELGAAWAHALHADVLYMRMDFDAALRGFQRAEQIFRDNDDVDGMGFTLNGQGNALDKLMRRQESLEFYRRAIDHYARANEPQGEGRSYGNAAGTLVFLGDLETAQQYAERSLKLVDRKQNAHAYAVALLTFGNILSTRGKKADAVETYKQAREVYQQLGDVQGMSIVDNNLGSAFEHLGDHALAMEYHHRALAGYESINDVNGVSASYANLGALFGNSGQYPEAVEYFQRARAIAQRVGNTHTEIVVTGNIGVVLFRMGDLDQAETHYQEATQRALEETYLAAAAMGYQNIGELRMTQDRLEEAKENFLKVRDLGAELGLETHGVEAQVGLANVSLRSGRLDEAGAYVDELRNVHPDKADVRWMTLQAIGGYEMAIGNLDAARTQFEAALSLAESSGLRRDQAVSHGALRDLAEKTNDLASYIHHNKRHQEINEEIAGKEASVRLAMQAKEREMMEEKLAREKERSLLYGALPKSVADRLIAGEDVSGDHYESVSILFLDIVKFTEISDRVPPGHVVHLLKAVFKVCDEVCAEHGLLKVKTIGDSYMAAAGIPEPLEDHAQRAAQAAIDMMQRLDELQLTMPPELGDTSWTQDIGELKVRIGLHCGPVVAGIVGEERLQYDVWGDTVNTASRMESTGEAGRIQVSSQFHEQLSNRAPSNCKTVERGTIDIKGKGTMTTYWLEGA